MPCILAADIKVIVELHLKAEPLPGNGWGGLRLISIEDQPKPRQQFLATGEIFSGHRLLLLVIGFYKGGRASLVPFVGTVINTLHMQSHLILPVDLRKYIVSIFTEEEKLQLK